YEYVMSLVWVSYCMFACRSTTTPSEYDSTTSNAVSTPPTLPTALVSSPAALEEAGAATRIVIEYPGPGTGMMMSPPYSLISVSGCSYGTACRGNVTFPNGESAPCRSAAASVTAWSSPTSGQCGSTRRCLALSPSLATLSSVRTGVLPAILEGMPVTSLADSLRARTDAELTELLQLRRDLATPPPRDIAVLATRAGTAGSVT